MQYNFRMLKLVCSTKINKIGRLRQRQCPAIFLRISKYSVVHWSRTLGGELSIRGTVLPLSKNNNCCVSRKARLLQSYHPTAPNSTNPDLNHVVTPTKQKRRPPSTRSETGLEQHTHHCQSIPKRAN